VSVLYPYIPAGRTIKYVSAQDRFIRAAEDVCRELSTDHNHPTGAVLVTDGQVISRAANQAAIKSKKLTELHRKGWCTRKFFRIPTGQKYWLCPGCSPSRIHAETLVVKNARRKGVNTRGADVYLWGHWWCCEPCWDAMISAGIRDVYLLEGSERLFNKNHPDHIIGKQFEV